MSHNLQHLMTTVFRPRGVSLPHVNYYSGAWFYKQPATIGGIVYDERRGLGTPRSVQPRRAMLLNGTNQAVSYSLPSPMTYPFSLFGLFDVVAATNGAGLLAIQGVSSGTYSALRISSATSLGLHNIDINGGQASTINAFPAVSNIVTRGWMSVVLVVHSSTSASIYLDGVLIGTIAIASFNMTSAFGRFAIGTLSGASGFANTYAQHCGYLRRAATLQDAIDFHNTGFIPNAEGLFLLDANSTTLTYNIGTEGLPFNRTNLLSWTEDVTNTSVWTRVGTTTPNSSTLTEDSSTGEHRIQNFTAIPVAGGVSYTTSVEVKPNGRTRVRLGFDDLATMPGRAFFTLSGAGSFDNLNPGTTASITALDDGWYRIKVTATTTTATSRRIELNLVTTGTTVNYTGDNSSGVLVRKLNWSVGDVDYQPITAGTYTNQATISNGAAGMLYTGRDVPFSRQNDVGYTVGRNRFSSSNNAASSWVTENLSISGFPGAQVLTPTTTLGRHSFRQDRLCTGPNVISADLKANGYNIVSFGVAGGVTGQTIYFNLATGVVSGSAAGYVGTMVSLGDGWYRCSLLSTGVEAETSYNRWILIRNTTSTSDYAGNGTSGVLFRIAQLEAGSVATAPQITGSSNLGALIPIRLSDGLDADGNTPEFSGPVPMNGQAQQSNCLSFDGTDDYIAMNLDDVAGPELVANGTFTTDTAWTKGTGWTISGGVATRINTGGNSDVDQSMVLVPGRSYLVTYTISSVTSGGILPRFSGGTSVSGTLKTTIGTFSEVLTALSGNNLFRMVASAVFAGSIDNVSVKLLPTLTDQGTSVISYRSDGLGITGTAGTACDIRLGDVGWIPCSEGKGSRVHDTDGNSYQIVNGQASNWTTLQDDFNYNLVYGCSIIDGVYVPAILGDHADEMRGLLNG